MTQFAKGQTVRITTRDHGHLAASKVKGFTGIVIATGESTIGTTGETYQYVSVKLAPTFKTLRHFNTRQDAIEVVE